MGVLDSSRSRRILSVAMLSAFIALAPSPTRANVITDWDEKAVAVMTPTSPYVGQRAMAMVHVAMFDAVNSIERRYKPYLTQLPADPDTSKEAAAASAAAAILVAVDAKTAAETKSALASYLAAIPDGAPKTEGIRLGGAIAAKVLDARANDGVDAPDTYRPRTAPGVYVPTPITAASTWPNLKPFVLIKQSQFRPGPPVALKSKEWARDYNEIKDYGGKASTMRSAEQTETARFWLMVGPPAYHPFARKIAIARRMDVAESARFMALTAVALNDALIAVFDAKYHYNFWRPITAIRNGDIDGNPATEREASWQPIDNTPMHPEYPCAHCISSGAVSAVAEAVLGSAGLPEIELTSLTAPGVTHRWTSLRAFADEVASARIWAGFHYRASTRVGTDMGRKIGDYVAKNAMQPSTVASVH